MQFQLERFKEKLSSETRRFRFDASETLRSIAHPRLTGSKEAEIITEEIRSRFESLGYGVRDQRFVISTWPGRFSVSLAGLFYLAGAIGGGMLTAWGHPGIAVVVQLTVLLVIGAIAVLSRPAMSIVRFGRVEAANLVAAVEGKRPRYYLMAHRDSKSQPIPLAFRGPAIVLGIVAWVALFVLELLALLDATFINRGAITILSILAATAGLILVFSWVNNNSPGALDNASGVATLLGVAEREVEAGDVAFIITDAEELGLAGANAVASTLPPSFGVINIDGIDDYGSFHIVERFGWPRKRGAAPHLAAALLGAAAALNHNATRRSVPIGLLLDHIPIVRAGTPAVTLMRGDLKSLSRVHRPADNLEKLKGTGVEDAVSLVSAALQLLREQQS
jgi:Peptidase family M28